MRLPLLTRFADPALPIRALPIRALLIRGLVMGALLVVLERPAVLAEEPIDEPASRQPHLVMLIAEREYATETTLPAFARQQLRDRFRVTTVTASDDDPNRMPGIEAVADADVLLISVRRRTLPQSQLDQVRRYVDAAKPVIGIRTANHAFCLRNGQPDPGRAVWPNWDRDVFGGSYSNHHGNSLQTRVTFNGDPATDALLNGINRKPFVAGGSLYKVAPLAEGAGVLLTGRVDGHDPQPVAWTYLRADGGKSFYTSLGHVDDFRGDVLPRLLRNAIDWAVEP